MYKVNTQIVVQSVIPHAISEITIVQLNTLNTAFTVSAYVAYVTSPYMAAGIIILNVHEKCICQHFPKYPESIQKVSKKCFPILLRGIAKVLKKCTGSVQKVLAPKTSVQKVCGPKRLTKKVSNKC